MHAVFPFLPDCRNILLKHIFESGELDKDSVVRKIRTTAKDGKGYKVLHYNLDVIISVGYRVKTQYFFIKKSEFPIFLRLDGSFCYNIDMSSGRTRRRIKGLLPSLIAFTVFVVSLGVLIYQFTLLKMPEYEELVIGGKNDYVSDDLDRNPPVSLAGATYLQDLKVFPETCYNAAPGTEAVLTDFRDGNAYRVKKFQDGNCWMLDPLMLQLNEGAILDEQYSDVSYFENDTRSAHPGFYAWQTATAGAGTAEQTGGTAQSICPAGWTLPGNQEFPENSAGLTTRNFKSLMTAYNLSPSDFTTLGFAQPTIYYDADGAAKDGSYYLLAQGVSGEPSKVSLFNFHGYAEDSSLQNSKDSSFPLICVAR